MAKIPSILSTAKKELFTLPSLLGISIIFFVYYCFTVFTFNSSFFLQTLFGAYPIAYKTHVLFLLHVGLFSAFAVSDIVITLVSGLLVGVNGMLLFKTIRALGNQGKVSLSVGGATIIGLVSTGCASCGLSVLSLVGISSTLSFLPFRGMEVHIFSAVLLLLSSWYMVKKLRDGLYCKVK